MGFIWSIIIGIVAGYLAGKIMRGGGFGVIVNLILGIIGGVLYRPDTAFCHVLYQSHH